MFGKLLTENGFMRICSKNRLFFRIIFLVFSVIFYSVLFYAIIEIMENTLKTFEKAIFYI